MQNISVLVKSIQDIMRRDAGTYGDAQRLEQMGWMFFLRILDAREQELEEAGAYSSPLPGPLRWRSWATGAERVRDDELVNFVDRQLLPGLEALRSADPLIHVVKMTFSDANNYMKNGTLMRQVIDKIQAIDFTVAAECHVFGDIYEKLLKDLQSAGNAGEFYTPRAVTQFVVERVDPRLGEKLLDPACGTGGFLTCAVKHLRKQIRTPSDEELIQHSLAGIEKKHLPHVLCITNLLLHGISIPVDVQHNNTLSKPLADWRPSDQVNVVVTNPPFGGMEEDGIESNFPVPFRTRETADLFLVFIMTILREGGRAGVVLPDGTLFGSGVKTRIKEALLSRCNLHTIVRLPNGVFHPYTNIKTNLLFFTKGKATEQIWYYDHPLPEGRKGYTKSKPISDAEFDGETRWWKQRIENRNAWSVSISEIIDRDYDLDIANPHQLKSSPGDVSELLPRYEALLKRIAETREILKSTLAEGLSSSSGDER